MMQSKPDSEEPVTPESIRDSEGALESEPASTQEASSAGEGYMIDVPVKWRIVRGLGKFLILFGTLGFLQLIPTIAFDTGRLVGYMLGLVVIGTMLWGGIWLARFASVKVSRIDSRVEKMIENMSPMDLGKPMRKQGRLYKVLLVATVVAMLPFVRYLASCSDVFPDVRSLIREIPEVVFNVALLVGVFGGVYALVRIRRFVWWKYVVAVMAVTLPLSSIWVPAMAKVRERVRTTTETQSIMPIPSECAALLTKDAFVEAIKSPRVLDKYHVDNGSVLVLEAQDKDGNGIFECVRGITYEKYMSVGLLARAPQDIRVVVALGQPGPYDENPGGFVHPAFARPSGVVAPFLIFRWPEKSLLMTGAVKIKGVFEVEPVRRRIASELNGVLRGSNDAGRQGTDF
jgi:hypothetical protein